MMIARGFNVVPFNGYRLPGIAVASSLFEAIRVRLKAVPALSGLTDVYKNHPPRGWSLPYIVMSSITGMDDIFNTNEYWRSGQYQFSVLAADDIQAETIGEAAYTALLPVSAIRYPPLTFVGGYEIVRWPLYHGRLIEQPGRGPNNQNVWMYTFGYRIETGHVA